MKVIQFLNWQCTKCYYNVESLIFGNRMRVRHFNTEDNKDCPYKDFERWYDIDEFTKEI